MILQVWCCLVLAILNLKQNFAKSATRFILDSSLQLEILKPLLSYVTSMGRMRLYIKKYVPLIIWIPNLSYSSEKFIYVCIKHQKCRTSQQY